MTLPLAFTSSFIASRFSPASLIPLPHEQHTLIKKPFATLTPLSTLPSTTGLNARFDAHEEQDFRLPPFLSEVDIEQLNGINLSPSTNTTIDDHDESPTWLSQSLNNAPLFIKKMINNHALNTFKARNPLFDTMLRTTQHDLADIGNEGLSALVPFIHYPDYYQPPVHLPLDGHNNGMESAMQAPAAHDGLYKNNMEIRSTAYDPAIDYLRTVLTRKPNARIAFIGSGFGGDAINFIERVAEKNPRLLKKLSIDTYDLSAPFLDVGSREIPRRLHKLCPTNHHYELFSTAAPSDQLKEKTLSVNAHHIGYQCAQGIIKHLYLKDVSAPDFISNLKTNRIGKYDLVFAMYVFHEMPESKIRSTLDNIKHMGNHPTLIFQDMDFEKKIQRLTQEGTPNPIGSFVLSVVFSATEPYSHSPPSSHLSALLSEYGHVTPLAQSGITQSEATIQSFAIAPAVQNGLSTHKGR